MAKYDEVEIIKRAYDELKALDEGGVNRALEYLRERFASEHEAARLVRQQEQRDRIAKMRKPERSAVRRSVE